MSCSPVQWKWVGTGWAPVSPHYDWQSRDTNRVATLRNRRVEIILWIFIIFLLVVIGLLTYSHLELLSNIGAYPEHEGKTEREFSIIIL